MGAWTTGGGRQSNNWNFYVTALVMLMRTVCNRNRLPCILHLDQHLHPYNVHLTQQLKPADHSQRRRYVEWVLE